MIDRQAALDSISAWRRDYPLDLQEPIDDCWNAVRELPAVQPEQKWIPCSERFPEGGSYLVWMPFAPPEGRIAVADYCDGYWNIKTPISAWMPLPKPYWGGASE